LLVVVGVSLLCSLFHQGLKGSFMYGGITIPEAVRGKLMIRKAPAQTPR